MTTDKEKPKRRRVEHTEPRRTTHMQLPEALLDRIPGNMTAWVTDAIREKLAREQDGGE